MKIPLGLVSLAFVAMLGVACRHPSPSAWTIVPGARLGPFSVQGTEADLRSQFGDAVQPRPFSIGEGESVPGSVVFPDDPRRRVEIAWRDTTRRRELKTVRVDGEASLWRLENRVGIGATLVELERMNGRPFRLAGFGWDHQGVVRSWNGGTLEPTMKSVYLYFAPDPRQVNGPAYRRVMGDREFSSNDSDVRALEPRVARMVIAFDVLDPP